MERRKRRAAALAIIVGSTAQAASAQDTRIGVIANAALRVAPYTTPDTIVPHE